MWLHRELWSQQASQLISVDIPSVLVCEGARGVVAVLRLSHSEKNSYVIEDGDNLREQVR